MGAEVALPVMAITCAMLDITGKATSAPIYRVLGGPTRYKARAMAALWGTTDSELATSMNALARQGFQAFEVPIPSFNWRNQGQARSEEHTSELQSRLHLV